MQRATGLCTLLCLSLPALGGTVDEIKILNDQAPDCSSLAAIVKSVAKECKTDDAKAIAIFNFLRYVNYHHQYPNEKNGIPSLKLINVYGWSLCGGQHAALSSLWEQAGFKWRFRGWNGHTTVEAQYGGTWHFLDTFMNFYAWRKDPKAPGGFTVASQEDLGSNPNLALEGFEFDAGREVWYRKGDRFALVDGKANWTAPIFMCCGDDLKGIPGECKASKDCGSPRGWMGIQFDDNGYSTAVNLLPGFSLTLDWNKVAGAHYFSGQAKAPRHSCSDKEYRNDPIIGPMLEPYRVGTDIARSWSNGTLRFKPDLRDAACLAGLKDLKSVSCKDGVLRPETGESASFVVSFASPYVMTKAGGSVTFQEPDAGAVWEIQGADSKWSPVVLADFTKAVYGRYTCDLRVTFSKPITALDIPIVVQHNQEALPYLAPGKNTLTVTVKDPAALGKNRLVVTYAYYTGSRYRSPERMLEKDLELSKGHAAEWSKTPVVVQKVVDKFPCTFEIVVPTPKTKFPVYPRMAFLRREVLAPGAEPLPAPAAASEPQVGAEEALATLPYPFTIGTQPPKPATAEAAK